jgi:nucleotide-binding universal stress UspA family protein
LSVRLGDPVAALHEVSQEKSADLLVMGSRGHHGLPAVLLGSIAVHVVSGASCPVVTLPPGAGERFVAPATPGGMIICGVDGSAESERALSVAARLGERMGLEALPVFVDPASNRNHPAPSATQILSGDPARELRERASHEDARLVVVGSRERGALRRALLGSVSAALASSAPVPVLVVPLDARIRAAGAPRPAAASAA